MSPPPPEWALPIGHRPYLLEPYLSAPCITLLLKQLIIIIILKNFQYNNSQYREQQKPTACLRTESASKAHKVKKTIFIPTPLTQVYKRLKNVEAETAEKRNYGCSKF